MHFSSKIWVKFFRNFRLLTNYVFLNFHTCSFVTRRKIVCAAWIGSVSRFERKRFLKQFSAMGFSVTIPGLSKIFILDPIWTHCWVLRTQKINALIIIPTVRVNNFKKWLKFVPSNSGFSTYPTRFGPFQTINYTTFSDIGNSLNQNPSRY